MADHHDAHQDPPTDDAMIGLEPEDPSPSRRAESDMSHLPPDEGPEQHVITVRPSFWRGRPFSSLLLALAPIALSVGLMFLPTATWKWTAIWIVAGVMVVLCWGTLVLWWITITMSQSLRVTNKRIIEKRGLFSRNTDEVLLDHIRNVKVEQNIVDRVMGIGRIGISSSGQDEIEVQMADIPRPNRLADILDRYRELG